MQTNCTYGDPVDASGTPATGTGFFQFATSSCLVASSTVATTTDVVFTATMDAGEVVIAFFLLVLIILRVFGGVISALVPIKTTRVFLGNNSRDGKETMEV